MKRDYFNFNYSNSKVRSLKRHLLALVMMLSVSFSYAQSTITIVTDSDYSLWNLAISNPSVFLDWTANGPGINLTETGTNTPTFDLSPNVGFGDVTIETTGTPANFAGITFLKADNGVGLRIKTIDVSDLPNLQRLDVDDNTIESLDLSNNLNLLELNVNRNDLININLSANTNLTELYIEANTDLVDLDISNNTNLEILRASSLILISDIDISNNTQLIDIDFSNVPLTSASIDKILNDLDGFGLNNGDLNLQNTAGGVITKDGIAAYINLITPIAQGGKGWTIIPPQGFDVGDALDSYGTLIASGGAIHLNDPFHDELRLGNSKDFETDGFPSTDADGDDIDQFDDEDGVVQSELDGLTTSTVSWDVDVSLTSNYADLSYLHAWIDFDGNGTFDADEYSTLEIPVDSGQGTYTLTWDITALGADIQSGQTYARFRFTKDNDLTSADAVGYATGGEVEDYTLVIELDTDGDGVPDSADLDIDNDGILNTDEVGDSNGNGTDDMFELDSDDDTCDDVIEAGYTDGDLDGILGTSPVVVDDDGLITDDALGPIGDGFTTPNDLDNNLTYDFQEAGSAASITTDPVDQDFILAGSATFTATAVADTYQWEVSIDGGANWNPVANDANNAGADTNTLTVSNLTIDVYYLNTYRLVAEYVSFACDTTPAESLAAGFNVLDDFDGDLVPDIVDLDADNDGILNTDEVGDSNGNGTDDMFELDSDDDTCDDVIEAGYTDGDLDGILGTSPVVVDDDGLITDDALGPIGDGFTTPNDLDNNLTYDFQEAGSAASITTDPVDQDFILAGSATFTATAVADTYQWEVSIDGGANWNPVANDANNAGADTNTLTVSNLTIDVYYLNTYRLVAEYVSFACDTTPAESLAAGFNVLDDFDGDLVPDIVDLDADNDGILNTDEPGDSNANGTDDMLELDADGDGCFDTLEAGVIDGDEDGIVGTGAITDANVDADGLVVSDSSGAINSPGDAYGPLNDLNVNGILDSQEAGTPANITNQPIAQVYTQGGTATFTVVLDLAAGDGSYQWQEDSGSGFADIPNGAPDFSGQQEASLIVTIPNDYSKVFNSYRVIVSNVALYCDPTTTSEVAGFIIPGDFDKDGVFDDDDLDDDNDGISDIVEDDGVVDRDTDNDGSPDKRDFDADGDGCFDTLESGVLDGDQNGLVGTGIITDANVDADGLVVTDAIGAIVPGTDAYGPLNDLDGNGTPDFQEAGSAASITTDPVDQNFVLAGSAVFSATAIADTYQWEVSVDGGLNWADVINDANNTGADTNTLTVSNLTIDVYYNNTYRLVAEYVSFACDIIPAVSAAAGFNALDDFDGDAVPDIADQDDDNDGITDDVENQGGLVDIDTDSDGFPDRIDLDADGDGCFDVEENLYDNNGSNEIGTQDPPVVDPVTGIVTSLTAGDGYGTPEDQDGNGTPDFQEAGAAAAITTQPSDQNLLPGDPATFTVVATADTFQWEESTNGGTDWSTVSDGGNYSGATTASLTILSADLSMINYQYRVMVSNIAYACDPVTTSDAATLVSLPDNDNDGVPDVVDVDDDNDGIFDTDEQDAGGVDMDSNGNGTPDRFELDSDSDGCDDVTEAGFTNNGFGMLGNTNPPTVLANGQVDFAADGYTTPNDLDNNGIYDFQEAGTAANITSDPVDQDFVLGGAAIFDAGSDGNKYQWEISADGVNFTPLSDDAKYSGTTTASLTVSGLVIPDYFNEYRVVASNLAFSCDPGDASASASYNILTDTDTDGVFDIVDVDDDNDGILDTVEGEVTDTNLDGRPDRISLDADSDGCADAIEAGFTDPDGDGIVGTSPVTVNDDGKVIADANGPINDPDDAYDTPNDLNNNNVFDFQEAGSASKIENQPEEDEISLGDDAEFEVDGNATYYQWQESMDDGGSWYDLSNDDKYSGVDTDRLRITDARGRLEGSMYRVVLTSPDYACDPVAELISDGVRLIFNTELIPSGFSPNGDGTNDLFSIPGLIETPDFTMEVFDRWGNSVYKYANNNNLSPDWWDGRSTGNMTLSKGQMVPAGTYFYLIHYNDGDKSPDKGWVYVNY